MQVAGLQSSILHVSHEFLLFWCCWNGFAAVSLTANNKTNPPRCRFLLESSNKDLQQAHARNQRVRIGRALIASVEDGRWVIEARDRFQAGTGQHPKVELWYALDRVRKMFRQSLSIMGTAQHKPIIRDVSEDEGEDDEDPTSDVGEFIHMVSTLESYLQSGHLPKAKELQGFIEVTRRIERQLGPPPSGALGLTLGTCFPRK